MLTCMSLHCHLYILSVFS